jgi:large subunit ribosomal protein L5
MQRLYSFYLESVTSTLQKNFNYSNSTRIPKLKKIVVSRGLNSFSQNNKILDLLTNEFNLFSCQRPTLCTAKKAISSFKVKEGMNVGMFVTLRGEKMYAFFDRLVNLAFPRIKDFQGFSRKGFDGFGNFNLGLNEQLMFPEIDFDNIVKADGMTISIITTSKTDQEAYVLLKLLGMPFNS